MEALIKLSFRLKGEILISTIGRDLYEIPRFVRDAYGGFLAALEMTRID